MYIGRIEPYLSNPRLSIPSIIWSDFRKILKQVTPYS